MGYQILQGVVAFIGCLSFSIILYVPRKELVYCGFTGGFGWFIYCIINSIFNDAVISSFFSAIVVTASSRFLSHVRKQPSTLFLIPGILPLVPGAGMYYTMDAVLKGSMIESYIQAVNTLKVAGVIAIGIIMILSLPYSVFGFIKVKEK